MVEATVARIKRTRMVYLAGSTLTLLFLGLIYAFSMFSAPMCAAFGLEKGAVGLTFNIMMIMFCIGAIIGSQIERKAGVKGALLVGHGSSNALAIKNGVLTTARTARADVAGIIARTVAEASSSDGPEKGPIGGAA